MTKNLILDESFDLWQKFPFLTKISIFYLYKWYTKKLRFFRKKSYFSQKNYFWQKNRFLTKKIRFLYYGKKLPFFRKKFRLLTKFWFLTKNKYRILAEILTVKFVNLTFFTSGHVLGFTSIFFSILKNTSLDRPDGRRAL